MLRSPVTALQYFTSRARGGPWGSPDEKYPGRLPRRSRQTRVRDGFPSGRRPRGPPESPKKGQEAPKRPQDGNYTRGPRCRKIVPRRPRWPPDAPRGLQVHSQEGPKRQNSLLFLRFWRDVGVSTFSASQDSPRGPRDGPKRAQEAPKMAPRTAQEGSKTAQEACMTAQEGFKNAPRGAPGGEHETTFRALGLKKPPGGPKRPLRGPQEAPRGPPEALRRPPRGPQAAPGGPPNAVPSTQASGSDATIWAGGMSEAIE